ncbi:unnamed protein product [Dicrocoelium dendriticum]|nr:unnamed protein product [Dicrocoelium dendriticum]
MARMAGTGECPAESQRSLNAASAIMQIVPGFQTNVQFLPCCASKFKPRSVYTVYPPPMDHKLKPPPRVDPYNYAHKKPKTHMLETSDVNEYIHNRSSWMLQNEYQRSHNAWKRYYYGTPTEKEEYGAYIRQGLKQQMLEKSLRMKEEERCSKKEEAEQINQFCKKFDEAVDSELKRRRAFLQQFREANKQLSEQREKARKRERQEAIAFEIKQLQHNPINWSYTLK